MTTSVQRKAAYISVFCTHGLFGKAPNPSNSGVNYKRVKKGGSKQSPFTKN
jgi:hypothetical protein